MSETGYLIICGFMLFILVAGVMPMLGASEMIYEDREEDDEE